MPQFRGVFIKINDSNEDDVYPVPKVSNLKMNAGLPSGNKTTFTISFDIDSVILQDTMMDFDDIHKKCADEGFTFWSFTGNTNHFGKAQGLMINVAGSEVNTVATVNLQLRLPDGKVNNSAGA